MYNKFGIKIVDPKFMLGVKRTRYERDDVLYVHLSQEEYIEEIYNSFRFQIPSISPFCLKLESWLKLHGIKYQVGLRTEHSLLPLTSCHPCLWSDEGLQHCSTAAGGLLQCCSQAG